ncbi:MAG: 2-oxoacid:acceptor oxidoreductase family protein [Atribacterota bacterium]|nr:2-oxoacid:acceptor oxidoreductase family protein [Atribacterota bacterium]
MRKIIEVRWHGRGGQGAVTASKLLATSAIAEGKYIQAFPEYGPERMGAPIQSFTRISDEPIKIHCHVTTPDMVVVLDPTLISSIDITEGLNDNGVIVINADINPVDIRKKLRLKGRRVFTVDASRIALEELGKPLPNTPMIGALIKATNLLQLENVIADIKKNFGGKFSQKVVDGNVNAIKRAYQEVKSE